MEARQNEHAILKSQEIDPRNKNEGNDLISSDLQATEDKDLDRIRRETFTSDFRTGYISVKGFCLPEYYRKFADAIENFKVRDDDIWVCSFPKTGTTWTQEMVWCIANDLDFEGAKINISERFPFLDLSPMFDYSTIIPRTPGLVFPEPVLNSVSYVEKLASPRFIKCHLPFDLLPREIREATKKPKIIYVTRNPKDACISYFNHCKLTEGYRGNFQEFCSLFLAGKLCYTPFWKHVSQFWSKRNDANILFLKYEDMIEDLGSVIWKTADFLGKSADGEWANSSNSDINVERLVKHLSFESMKSNLSVNYERVLNKKKKYKIISSEGSFIRKGEKDQWKKEMTHEMCETFDKITRDNFGDYDSIFE